MPKQIAPTGIPIVFSPRETGERQAAEQLSSLAVEAWRHEAIGRNEGQRLEPVRALYEAIAWFWEYRTAILSNPKGERSLDGLFNSLIAADVALRALRTEAGEVTTEKGGLAPEA